jgi:hypothetical protein
VCQDATNNTYACLRVRDAAAVPPTDYRYCEFVDDVGTVEYFDYVADPYELTNLAPSLPPATKAALSARLAAATACKGAAACDRLLTTPIMLLDGSPVRSPAAPAGAEAAAAAAAE